MVWPPTLCGPLAARSFDTGPIQLFTVKIARSRFLQRSDGWRLPAWWLPHPNQRDPPAPFKAWQVP